MKFIRSLGRLCGLIVGAAFLFCTASPAVAQNNKAEYLAAIKGRKDAQSVITAAEFKCELVDAFYIGESSVETDEGTRELQIYELACKQKQGILVKLTKKMTLDSVMDCYQADALKKNNPDQPVCRLLVNKNHLWIQGEVSKISQNCVVKRVRLVGKAPQKPYSIYEVNCDGLGSGLYTLPNYNAPDSNINFTSCAQVLDTPNKCVWVDKKALLTAYQPLARKALSSCTLTDMRVLGATSEFTYYEFKCSDKTSIAVTASKSDEFRSVIDCNQVARMGATCKYSSSPVRNSNSAATNADYSKQLSNSGLTCTVQNVDIVGADKVTGRQLVEFQCAETQNGLAGYIPTPTSTGKIDLTDCFVAEHRGFQCKFLPSDARLARIRQMAEDSSRIKPDCVVKDRRILSVNVDNEVVVEIACENKRGYIAVINRTRDAFTDALPCQIAARRGWGTCTIPENGTYAAQ